MNLLKNINSILKFSLSNEKKPCYAEISEIGDRKKNQDYCKCLFTDAGSLFVLADGLGGHDGGELASKLFCSSVIMIAQTRLKQLNSLPEITLNEIAVKSAESMSIELQKTHPDIDAHTTCAIAWVSLPDHQLTTLHIGDSRIYRFNKDKLRWRSRDHSVVQMLVDIGEISEADMGKHPDQTSLTRSIAVGKSIKPSIKKHSTPLQKNEVLLLCSDGFWEMLTINEVLSLAKASNLENALQKWVNKAVKRATKKSDNVTAQIFISH